MAIFLKKLEMLKDMVQEAIDQGATTVEEVHRTIAEVPINQLESQGLLDPERAESGKELHHKTVGQIYDAIRSINREVGELASDIFAKLEDSEIISRNIDASEAKQAETEPTDTEKPGQ